ncbi:hypothetical protein ES703_97568 [subsurface metagenome]
MGHLKDIANQSKIQSFPSATFEIEGEPPASQCAEAKIESTIGDPVPGTGNLTDVGRFTGFNLAGKKITVLAPPIEVGTYDIVFNTNDNILTTNTWTVDGPVVSYYVHNGGSLILTRDLQSFAQFIIAAGYSYTIKGGKLYTNIPSVNLQPACSILFDPLT